MMRNYLWIAVCLCWMAAEIRADDLYVSRQDGGYASIQAAINAAKPGDVIHLDPQLSPYRERANFTNKSGKADLPIVLDGHGAMILGSEPIDPSQWEDCGDGVWRSRALAERLRIQNSIVNRFFFVFDGRPEYMGGASKHRAPTLKKPSELAVGQWTYSKDENAFYLRIASDLPLADAAIEVPIRSTGVQMRGNASHLVIRNLKVRHAWNDGFNIHGQCSDIVFENIEAIECGDDGISAHGQCQIVVNGFVSRGNANGICHVNESQSISSNVHISKSRAYDIYLLNESSHELNHVVVDAGSPRGVVFTVGTQVQVSGLVVQAEQSPVDVLIGNGATVHVDRSVFWNAKIHVQNASAVLRHTAVGGPEGMLTLTQPRDWAANDNVWQVKSFVYDGKIFAGDDLAEFNEVTGQGEGSVVREFTLEQAKTPGFH